MDHERLERAIAAVDAANSSDPNQVDDGGKLRPAGLVYGERMTEMLRRAYPDAGELLTLAARAQHIRRWTIPRSSYPMDRAGYLKWRNHLKRLHADLAGELMINHGYSSADIARVQALLQKENLKRDREAQALEDTACLVFLEFYADEFAARHTDEKVVSILKKTFVKMSEKGRETALQLPLSPRLRNLAGAALDA